MATPAVHALAFASGVALHALWFHGREHHFYAWGYIFTTLLTAITGVLVLSRGYGFPFGQAITTSIYLVSTVLGGIYTSLAVYRLFLNPLNRFPGPYWTRLGNIAWSAQLTKADGYQKLKALHDKHGDIIRIGSHDLSIVDPEGMQITYGIGAKASKSSWYEGDSPRDSLHTTRSKKLHDQRRRVWAPAFSDKALREYETTLGNFNDKVMTRFREFQNGPVNVTKWFNLYSFDAMGRLAFGKDYGMLDSGEKHWALQLLSEGMAPLGLFMPMWFFRILKEIPGLAEGYHKFVKFCCDELAWRVHNNGEKGSGGKGDIMGWLLKAFTEIPHPEDDPTLQADARLIIVAGSDTTAATLTFLFFHLAQEPAQVEKIREELRPVTTGEWSDKDIKNLPHLNGAINEALRLHPPVPSGLQRVTPKEGMHIGDTFIPGNTNFWMPQYVMGRDNRIYPSATSFLPERWHSKRDELIKHKDAFAPFSMGPFGCIGKNLAYMQVRTLTARILLDFDVAFAPGEDGSRILTKTKDHFTVDPGQLDLVFTPRKG